MTCGFLGCSNDDDGTVTLADGRRRTLCEVHIQRADTVDDQEATERRQSA